MRKNLIKVMLIFVLPLFLSTTILAADWIKIAEKSVAFKSETDKIIPQGAERKVSAIKLKCIQGSLNLKTITLNSDAGSKTVDNLGVLTKGVSSRSISLPKGATKLKSIEIEYASAGNRALGVVGVAKRAKVEVLGKPLK